MKEGWEYKKFEECVVKIPKQKQIKSKDYLPFGIYPVVSQEQELISGYYNDISYVYKHSKPIVVFGDHTKNIKFIDFDFVVGADGTHILKTIDKIETKFFYYTLKSIKLENLGYARHFKLLKREVIGFPSLDQQRRIVSYLDSSFQLIDKIKEKAQKSLSEAKALFQSALAEAMEPKEGWEEKTLGEIANDSADGPFGSNLKKEHYTSNREVRIIQLSNIGEDGWREENTKYTTFKHLNNISRSEVHPGDIVIAKMMPAGRAILCPDKELKYVLSSDAVKIVLKKGYYNRYFLYSINSDYFRIQVYENVSGSGRVRTSLTKLRNCIVRIPPLSTQHQIVSHLDKLSSNVKQMEEKYQKIVEECDALKQAMLRDVFE